MEKVIDNVVNRPIFIVGAPRSGTTLITQILSKHPDIFIFNETLFYDFLSANDFSGILTNDQRSKLVDHLESRIDARIEDIHGQTEFGCRFDSSEALKIKKQFEHDVDEADSELSAADILEIFMLAVAHSKGRRVWGDKTPNQVFHLDRIVKDYPESRIIYIVRDPRKFLLSYKFSWRQKGSRKDVAKLYNPLVTSLLWKRSDASFYKFVSTHKDRSNIIAIRYEDLVSDNQRKVREVMDFIDEPFDDGMIEIKGANSSFSGQREKLSLYEKSICEFICRNEMKRHNYMAEINPLLGFVTCVVSIFTLPVFLVNALPVVSRHFKGGVFRYLKARGIFGS